MTSPLRRYLLQEKTQVPEHTAETLSNPVPDLHPVEIHPPSGGDAPERLAWVPKTVFEPVSKYFGLINNSPILSYEIIRSQPGSLHFQFVAPSKRLERRIRTHLGKDIPGVGLEQGKTGLPVTEEDWIGGAVLTTGRKDWYPLQTEFEKPPVEAVVSALHRHGMQDAKIAVQVLWQPSTVGKPLHRYWWRRRGYKRIGYLRKDKTDVFPWHDRPATPREKRQADRIEDKIGSSRCHTAIRILIGGSEQVRARVKEVAGAFNVFENPETGQYLNTDTVESWRADHLLDFAEAVHQRKFAGYSRRFQTSLNELSGLISIPGTLQPNIQPAQP